jgi:hypothetical protein
MLGVKYREHQATTRTEMLANQGNGLHIRELHQFNVEAG